MLILQIIAPVVEGSALELGELIEKVDDKLKSSFDEDLDPYREILRSTEDIIATEFNRVAYLKPDTISKL